MRVQWTTFVDNEWLDWFVKGHQSGYGPPADVPHDKVHGQIPAWPDTLFEFLQAIVITKTTFTWRRHADGYLVLVNKPSPKSLRCEQQKRVLVSLFSYPAVFRDEYTRAGSRKFVLHY